jgi:hypothetical protein
MEQWEAKKAARNAPVSPSPRRVKIQPHDDGKGESAGKPSRAAAKPAKRKPARGVDMTAHAASMKPVPGATAAPGMPSLPALPSVAVRPLGVSPHDVDDDEDDDHADVAIPGGRASLGRQVVKVAEVAEEAEVEDGDASGAWNDAEESDEEPEADDAFAEEDESESFIVDSDDTGPEVDVDEDEDEDGDEDEDE